MSVTGIASSLFNLSTQHIQDRFKQFQQEFQQLGQDIQTGNLSAAQTDLANLQKLRPSTADGPAAAGSSLSQTLEQLGSDLKSGDLKDAQQLYSDLAQKLRAHHTHHEHNVSTPQIAQEFSTLQQALQNGSLTAAQQAYGSLQQDFQGFALNGLSSATATNTDGVSVQA
jgi:hypothetical protein